MELNANMLTLATSQRDAFNLKRVDKKNNLSIFTRQEKNWLLFFSALLPQSSTQGPQPSYKNIYLLCGGVSKYDFLASWIVITSIK